MRETSNVKGAKVYHDFFCAWRKRVITVAEQITLDDAMRAEADKMTADYLANKAAIDFSRIFECEAPRQSQFNPRDHSQIATGDFHSERWGE